MYKVMRAGLGVPVLAFALMAAGSRTATVRAADCDPAVRTLDGTCAAALDRGKAGGTFLRVDGSQAPVASRPGARELSNLFLAQAPYPGIDTFETVLIPFASLKEGQNPAPSRLNQFAVALGQAVVHDLTKSRTTLDVRQFGVPGADFVYAPTDRLCQKVVETSATTIYYFPCTATVTVSGTSVNVVLADASRYTLVEGTTWTYHNGPLTTTLTGKYTSRGLTFPLVSVLGTDDSGTTRVPINDVTSFLDLSIIYGNDTATNAKLRANDGTGRLKTAADGDIPFNDVGAAALPNDCGAFDPVSAPTSASGDSRVDDNLYLDAIHSLLFRNHNRDADWVRQHSPGLTDEQIFERARAINIARFQQQVYNELLPAMFGKAAVDYYVGPYKGYDTAIDPRIASSFDLAFRVAHSQLLLPPFLFDNTGAPVHIDGTLGFPSHSRPNCLFTTFRQVGGSAIAKSAMTQSAQAVTGQVSDLMRNIVFKSGNGQGTAPGNLDIEQLNIIRGREFQTPNFDALRKHWLGISVYQLPGCVRASDPDADPLLCFRYITADTEVATKLRDTYHHADAIDAFIGLMVEGSGLDGKLLQFPPTATAIILDQFRRTRASDPWFYLNTQNPAVHFSAQERKRINETVAESLDASYGIAKVKDALRVQHFFGY